MSFLRIFSNAGVVAASFARSGSPTADRDIAKVVKHHTRLLQTKTKARASGRPGPRAPTGDYRRSIAQRYEGVLGAKHVGYVGTNAPQGRRLEMGFTGVDSAGRYYDQQPYPHFGPAMDEVSPSFLDALGDAAVRPI